MNKILLIICQSVNSDLSRLYNIKKERRRQNVVFGDDAKLGLRFLPQINSMKALIKWANWAVIPRNIYQMRRAGVTHVLFDDASPFYLIYGVLLKFQGINLIFTLHDQVAHRGRGAMGMALYIFFASRFLANEIIVFSPYKLKKQAKVHQVQLGGYQGEASTIEFPENYGLHVILFGRIRKYKGYNHLASIAKRTIGLPIYYHVIGDGDSKLLNQLSDHPNISVQHRYVEDNEVESLFAKADLNLLPYDSGTQSGVALLAASFGVPSLAFNVGDLGLYLGKGIGTTVPAFDYDVMVDLLKEMLEKSSNTRALGRIATRYAYDNHFSTSAFRDSYLDIYNKILGIQLENYE